MNSCVVEKVKAGIEEFFNLPMEEKKKFFQQPGDMEGFGHAFVVSEEQKLDWGDLFYMTTLPKFLRKSHLFPNLPLPLRYLFHLLPLPLLLTLRRYQVRIGAIHCWVGLPPLFFNLFIYIFYSLFKKYIVFLCCRH